MTEGFLYVCADDEFLDDAKQSATQVQQVMPSYEVGIITDSKNPGKVFDTQIELPDPEYGFGDKVGIFDKTPYEKTIYLDADIYVTEPLYPVFETLNRFELCASHDVGRNFFHDKLNVPSTVPEYNTGVIAYRLTDAVRRFLHRWESIYQSHRESGINADQPAFRQAVWDTDICVGTLPSEYNCRINEPGFLNEAAKIIHGQRRQDRVQIAKRLNEVESWRIHSPIGEDIGMYSPEQASIIEILLFSLATNGIRDTTRIFGKELLERIT
jgi:hypothetical protein